jgi:hypothetical protein
VVGFSPVALGLTSGFAASGSGALAEGMLVACGSSVLGASSFEASGVRDSPASGLGGPDVGSLVFGLGFVFSAITQVNLYVWMIA